MPGTTGAIRYTCLCSTEYLIALSPDGDPEWLETIRQAGRAIQVEVVDGTLPSFICTTCREVHIREFEPAQAVDLPETLFTQVARSSSA